MSTQETIEQELNELKSSLLHGISTPYSVPGTYFSSLAEKVLTRIRLESPVTEPAETAPLLQSISRSTPFTLPDGYFEELPAKMLDRVKTPENAKEELEALSPLLAGIKKQTPYTLPANYFDSLIPETKEGTHRPVIRITRNRKWLRYVAAATVVAFIAVTAIFLATSNSSAEPVTNSYAWIEKNTQKINAAEIDEILKLAGEIQPDTITTDPQELRDVSELMRTVSDKDIQRFLNAVTIDEEGEDDELLFF